MELFILNVVTKHLKSCDYDIECVIHAILGAMSIKSEPFNSNILYHILKDISAKEILGKIEEVLDCPILTNIFPAYETETTFAIIF